MGDPPGPFDGAPTLAVGHSCAFCDSRDVSWAHPLDPHHAAFEVHGKGYTLPAVWALCEPCETIYRSGDDSAAIEVIGGDADEAAGTLAAFRRADAGRQRFDPEPMALAEAREHGFAPLAELTGALQLGPLWPAEHRLWLAEVAAAFDGDARFGWLIRSPDPDRSPEETLSALWRRVERDSECADPDIWTQRVQEFFAAEE